MSMDIEDGCFLCMQIVCCYLKHINGEFLLNQS